MPPFMVEMVYNSVDDKTKIDSSFIYAFYENVRKAGVEAYIEAMKCSSNQLVPFWTKPIDMLFIDGDHNYAEVKNDFINWSKFVRPGGWILFHDVTLPSDSAKDHKGPGQVVEELVIGIPEYTDHRLIDSLYSVRKIK
jgi:predicted O-methyltransferase YrrM